MHVLTCLYFLCSFFFADELTRLTPLNIFAELTLTDVAGQYLLSLL